jgi:hypothetical protein
MNDFLRERVAFGQPGTAAAGGVGRRAAGIDVEVAMPGAPPRKYVDVSRPYAGSPGFTAASAKNAGTAS